MNAKPSKGRLDPLAEIHAERKRYYAACGVLNARMSLEQSIDRVVLCAHDRFGKDAPAKLGLLERTYYRYLAAARRRVDGAIYLKAKDNQYGRERDFSRE